MPKDFASIKEMARSAEYGASRLTGELDAECRFPSSGPLLDHTVQSMRDTAEMLSNRYKAIAEALHAEGGSDLD